MRAYKFCRASDSVWVRVKLWCGRLPLPIGQSPNTISNPQMNILNWSFVLECCPDPFTQGWSIHPRFSTKNKKSRLRTISIFGRFPLMFKCRRGCDLRIIFFPFNSLYFSTLFKHLCLPSYLSVSTENQIVLVSLKDNFYFYLYDRVCSISNTH